MVYIKIDVDYIDINELSDMSTVPVEQIEHCLDKGLLDDPKGVKKYFPDMVSVLKKVHLAAGLTKINLSPDSKRDLVSLATDESSSGFMEALHRFGLSEEQSSVIKNYMDLHC